MYLKHIYIENNGPLRQVKLDLPFSDNGHPKPTILVGGNGSGKTNLLSIVADALFEAAAAHFQDAVAGMKGGSRPWFRVIGGSTISIGSAGSCTILEFEHDGASLLFKEKGGTLPSQDVIARVPETLRPAANWQTEGAVKHFSITSQASQNIFDSGVYLYFPASRSETPHWLNTASINRDEFDIGSKFTSLLNRTIYTERGLDKIKQWILSVFMDAKADVSPNFDKETGGLQFFVHGNHADILMNGVSLQLINTMLRHIVGDGAVSLGWGGRRSNYKILIHKNGTVTIPSIDGLSSGQSTLLNIFGTIAHHGDTILKDKWLNFSEISGICLIDEIDAHMHIGLQSDALPQLIKMFPRVQFIVSSHSPLFVLGMDATFGSDGISVFEMPTATSIQAEAYSEFDRALNAIKTTKAFNAAITSAAEQEGKFIVFLEGETDPKYLRTATELLGREALLDKIEFEWIGAKDPENGEGFHSGTKALNATLQFFRANPHIVKRKILLLHDNDVNKQYEVYGNVHVMAMPRNQDNNIVECGIENILSPNAITDDMFSTSVKKNKDGGTTTIRSLKKMELCKYLCDVKREKSHFERFSQILDSIEALL